MQFRTWSSRTLALAALFAAPFAAPFVAAPLSAQDDRRQSGRDRIDTTFAFDKTGDIQLSLPAGSIRVTGWARNEVRISAASDRWMIRLSASHDHVSLDTRG